MEWFPAYDCKNCPVDGHNPRCFKDNSKAFPFDPLVVSCSVVDNSLSHYPNGISYYDHLMKYFCNHQHETAPHISQVVSKVWCVLYCITVGILQLQNLT